MTMSPSSTHPSTSKPDLIHQILLVLQELYLPQLTEPRQHQEFLSQVPHGARILSHHIPFPTSRSNMPNILVDPSQTHTPSVASNRSTSSRLSMDLELERSLLTPRSNPSIASRTPPPVSPVPSQSLPISDRLSASGYALPQSLADEIRLPFARESDIIATAVKLENKPSKKGPRSSNGSDFGGLAYADSDSDYDDGNEVSKKDGIQFPSSSPQSSRLSESAYSTRIPVRSLSAASSSYARYGARSTARSVGALDRATEILFEDTPLSPTTNVSFSPLSPIKQNFPPGVENYNPAGDSSSKPPGLHTQSHTSPTMAKSRELDAAAARHIEPLRFPAY